MYILSMNINILIDLYHSDTFLQFKIRRDEIEPYGCHSCMCHVCVCCPYVNILHTVYEYSQTEVQS